MRYVVVAVKNECSDRTAVDDLRQTRLRRTEVRQSFLQRLGTICHLAFQCRVELPQRSLIALALGDIGIGGDEAPFRQRLADDLDDGSVRAFALVHVWLKTECLLHPCTHLFLDITGAILAALGVESHVGLERRTGNTERFGKLQQFQKPRIADNELEPGVVHRNALTDIANGMTQN